MFKKLGYVTTLTLAIAGSTGVWADDVIEEVVVIGQSTIFANNQTDEAALATQSPVTSALAIIDNLPGVSVQEGDTYGFDDWSTTVSIRGFQLSLSDQQIGTTIDGIANGNSGYGGGAKANRYIDTGNLAGAEVSQGTGDIASRSLEALGGTLNFRTIGTRQEAGFNVSFTSGEFDAERYFVRYNTGSLFGGETYAWISASHTEATDWINGAAENERDHFAVKVESQIGQFDLTGYLSHDDVHEDNYQRVYSAADVAQYPDWDQLTAEWSGVPYIDQAYRKGWSTLRENTLAYLTVDTDVSEQLSITASVYYHDNEGRGDWIPPYLVDVTADGEGQAHSEVAGAPTVNGGAPIGRIYFTDGAGVALTPADGCVSSLTFPYGGGGAVYDPACYVNGAIGQQSYRHSHYGKERLGFSADFTFANELGGLENELRGGIWYEDYERSEYRDWHKLVDTRVGYYFAEQAYWKQYDRQYPQTIFKWYVEDTLTIADLQVTLGVKDFSVELKRNDLFGETSNITVSSDSDLLFSGGVVYQLPVDGIEVFAGFAENYSALKDDLLERPASDFSQLEPETAENVDVGLRYVGERFTASIAYYDIQFENRIVFLDAESSAGPNYLIGTNGTYFNAGGIESNGIEATATYALSETLSFYGSYTNNESTYLGSGDAAVDAASGIVAGNNVINMPEQMAVLAGNWVSGPYVAGVSAKYTGERDARFDNTWKADGYWYIDIYAGVDGEALTDALTGLSFDFVVNNATDERFLSSMPGNAAWLGAPRTISITVSADF